MIGKRSVYVIRNVPVLLMNAYSTPSYGKKKELSSKSATKVPHIGKFFEAAENIIAEASTLFKLVQKARLRPLVKKIH